MGAHSCAVGHDGCHVRVLSELFEHIRPNTVLFPACVALEDAVPLAKFVWQFTPLGAGAQNPVNCLNETSTLFLLPCIGTRVTLQECVKFLPLIVGDLIGRHPSIVADLTKHNKRQRFLMCVHIENTLFPALRIAYCVEAGETPALPGCRPCEKSWFQTGFSLGSVDVCKVSSEERQMQDAYSLRQRDPKQNVLVFSQIQPKGSAGKTDFLSISHLSARILPLSKKCQRLLVVERKEVRRCGSRERGA